MARARRVYTAAERRELWERWKAGESVSDIARALDRSPGTIHCTLRERGGVCPPERRRARRALRAAEREEISRGDALGESVRSIARRLERAPSTISREIARNGGRGRYRATPADGRAWHAARRPQPCKLAHSGVLRELVACKLALDWSPQQIAGWLKVEYPDEPDMQVSHETIYLTLLIQARGALRRELIAHLRRLRSVRRPKGALSNSRGQGQIVDAVSIRERPAKGGGPGDPRPLGGRPAGRCGQHPPGNARRASLALCDARKSRRQGHPQRRGHHHREGQRAPHRALPLADLGSRQRARPPQAVHRRDRRSRLLLRSPQPPGSAAPTRTPTGCFASICPKAPTSRATARTRSTRSL